MRNNILIGVLVLAACKGGEPTSFAPTASDEDCSLSVTLYDPMLIGNGFSKSEMLKRKIEMIENCQNLTESTFRHILEGQLAYWLKGDPLVIEYGKIVAEEKAIEQKKYEGVVNIRGELKEFSFYISEASGGVLEFDR